MSEITGQPVAASQPERLISAGIKVLIVDDSRFIRTSIVRHLNGQYRYIEEEDGLAGWERITSDPDIKIVISDIQMPILNGFELLQRIRSSKMARIKYLPVIIISGSKEEANKASALGATEFITKSVGTTELLSRLKVLSKLAESQPDQSTGQLPHAGIKKATDMAREYERLWSFARRHNMNLVLISVRLDLETTLCLQRPELRERLIQKIADFMGQTLLKTIRNEDVLTQLPEHEFMVLALGIASNAAIQFAEGLSQAIARTHISYEGHDWRIGASFGIADSSESPLTSLQELKQQASRRSLIAAGDFDRLAING